mgnify:CR=1 FL=1
MDDIVSEFNKSLIIDSVDVLSDYIDLGISNALELENDIPIVKTIIGLGKIAIGIRERNLIKNLISVIKSLNSGNIDKEKLKKHQLRLKEDSKLAKKELGRVLIILDKTIDDKKAIILGKLYKAYVNTRIDWDMFIEFSEITDRMYVNDLEILRSIHDGTMKDVANKENMYRIDRLNSLGIVGIKPQIFQQANGEKEDTYIMTNYIGKKYCNIIFENN